MEMHKSAGASMRLILIVFLYLVVADGFAAFPDFCAPSYASARRIALPRHAYSVVRMVQDTPEKNMEAVMLLARRAVLGGVVVGAASLSGCRSGGAHCLTQACLSDPALLIQDPALGRPLSSSVTADSGEKAGKDEKAEGGRRLPASAYLPLKNGQVVCRLQLGLLQLSPKTSLSLPYKPFTRGEDMNRYWEARESSVVGAIEEAVRMGYTTFDLADVYGEAEEYVGAFHERYGQAEGVLFNSKWIPRGSSPKNLSEVAAAIDSARTRMRTQTLDVLQMYWWDYDKRYYVDMFLKAQQFVTSSRQATSAPQTNSAALLRGVGVTGFDRRHLEELVAEGVDVVSAQMSFSVVDTRPVDGGMTRYCADAGIAVFCHGTLLGGFLTDHWLGLQEPADAEALESSQLRKYYKWMRLWGDWSLFQRLLRTLRAIADQHTNRILAAQTNAPPPERDAPPPPQGAARAADLAEKKNSGTEKNKITIANVAMRWVLQQEGVTSAVVGARMGKESARAHLAENANVFVFELNAEDLEAIAAVQKQARPLRTFLGDVGDEFHKKNRKS